MPPTLLAAYGILHGTPHKHAHAMISQICDIQQSNLFDTDAHLNYTYECVSFQQFIFQCVHVDRCLSICDYCEQ